MEFYDLWQLRSILLLKIHNTHIAHIRGQYLLYYMSIVYGSSPLVYGYILLVSLRHGATIVTSYCTVVTSDTMVPPS